MFLPTVSLSCTLLHWIEKTAAANMVLMTMIARVSDGLPLAASVQDDEMVSCFPHLTRLTS